MRRIRGVIKELRGGTKARLRRWAGRALGVPGVDQMEAIERQLRWHSNILNELAVESVHSPRSGEWLRGFLVENGLPADIDPTISPDDRMFQYLLYIMLSYRDAVAEYFASGAQVLGVIEALSAARFGSLGNVDALLDFAAGHGRVGRYLVRRMDGANVWVADIKPGAVQFQASQFGVNGLISSARPEDFRPDRRFDIIFVASLFSHLPRETFHGWLRQLWGLLTDRGVLAFSAHDAFVHPDGHVEEHKFSAVNEEVFLDRVVNLDSSEGVLNAGQYGMAWVTESYVAGAVKEECGGAPYVRYRRGLGSKLQNQDLYLVSPAGVEDLAGLDFPHYLMVKQYRKVGWAGSWLNAVRKHID
jgi:Methyltransferase domain